MVYFDDVLIRWDQVQHIGNPDHAHVRDALLPANAVLSVTLWKDMPYACTVLALTGLMPAEMELDALDAIAILEAGGTAP